MNIGFILFPNVTQLDFTGPLQVLSRLPGADLTFVAATAGPGVLLAYTIAGGVALGNLAILPVASESQRG